MPKLFPEQYTREVVNEKTGYHAHADYIDIDVLKMYPIEELAQKLGFTDADLIDVGFAKYNNLLNRLKAILKTNPTDKACGEPIDWDSYLDAITDGKIPSRQYFVKNQRRFTPQQLQELNNTINNELITQ